MNRIIIAIFATVMVFQGCTKEKQTPDGPTDIRIRNITDTGFINVIVNTGEEEHIFGDLAAHAETDYYRYEIAYPDAEITFTIGGNQYTTSVPDNTYAVPLQQGKFTYEVWISDESNKKASSLVVADAPLGDK